MKIKTFRFLPCIAAGVLLTTLSLRAAPYASGVTNNNGTIQYYLNSAPAGMTVTVTTYPSGTQPALNPATPAQGTNSFLLGSDTSYTIAVSQVGSGSPSLETIAAANTNNIFWGSPDPRGLAINTSPTNAALFGSVYVASSAAGSSTTHGKGLFAFHSDMSLAFGTSYTGSYGTTWTAGGTSGPFKLSVSTSDGTVWANDETAANANVWQCDPFLRTSISPLQILAGLGSSAAPLVHGQEYGKSLATGTLAAGNLVLYTFDITMPSVATNSLGGSGGTGGAFAPGASYFSGTLEYNTAGGPITATGSYNCLYRYNMSGINSIPSGGWTNQPDLAVAEGLNIQGLVGDMDVAPDGKLFIVAERTNPGSAPYLTVYDPTGLTNVFCSATSASDDQVQDQIYGAGVANQYAAPYSVKVSPDDKFVALYGIYGYIAIYSLTNGVPDISSFTYIANAPVAGDGREIAWDAADNVYGLSSGSGYLNIYDLGLTTTCVTSNDSTGLNGSFALITPNLQASVVATTPIAYQANNSYAGNTTATPAVFTISLNAPQSVAANIAFTLTGTATNGVNYASTSTSINFPAGVTSETVTITPTANPASGPTLSVTLSLKSGAAYSAVAPASATAYIANSGPQVLNVGAITYPTMYRGTPGDNAGFQIVRYGDTNVGYTIPSSVFSYTGTAINTVDYTSDVPSLTVNPGDLTETAVVSDPVSTAYPFTYVGNKTIIVTLSAASGFTIGSSNSATMTLLDNANPPETILWSDELTNANDTGWNLAFGSEATGVAGSPTETFIPNYVTVPGGGSDAAHDYDVEFGYALGDDSLIGVNPLTGTVSAPNGATSALKVTVNKIAGLTFTVGTTTETGADGAVSLYPAGPNGVPMKFIGNYALRFSELSYEDSGSYATEFTQWGINHIGTNANWWSGSGLGGAGTTNVDGVWYSLTSDQGGAGFGDVVELTSTNIPNTGWVELASQSWANFAAAFKHPPYNSSGTGAFSEGYGNQGYLWNDVELKQVYNVITLSINKTVIYTYTNTTLWTNGDIMLGYEDPFASIGVNGEAYFSNVRVVELGPEITNQPTGTATVGVGTNVTLKVGAVGVAPFTNTWYLGSTKVQTDTSSVSLTNDSDSYAFTVASATAGSYTVVVSDASGSTTSSVVAITAGFPPVLATPASITTNQDVNVSFATTVTVGTTPLTYQWQFNGANLANGASSAVLGSVVGVGGATNNTLTLTNIQPADSGTFSVKVSNAYGSATTFATLAVVSATPVTIASASLASGKVTLHFSSSDIYDTTNSYRLLSSTNLLSGFTNTTATITVSGGTNFQVTVTPSGAVEYFLLQHK
jgi:hypothetical protein